MLSLDKSGILSSLLLGLIVYFFAGSMYLLLMIFFLILSVYVTRYGYWEKKEKGVYEYSRGWKNVLSNGLFPAVFAVLSPYITWVPFAASVAAITADKFASEIGVLDDDAYDILTFKKTRPGKSGAISILGTLASLSGAAIIGLASMFLFSATPELAFNIMIFGFLGNIMDSFAGFFEERGFGTKETSNLICALTGGLFALL